MIDVAEQGIVSKAIVENEHHKIIHFTLAAGQELSEHTASVPAVIQVLQGKGTVSLGGNGTRLGRGCSTTCRPSSSTPSSPTATSSSCSRCSGRERARRVADRDPRAARRLPGVGQPDPRDVLTRRHAVRACDLVDLGDRPRRRAAESRAGPPVWLPRRHPSGREGRGGRPRVRGGGGSDLPRALPTAAGTEPSVSGRTAIASRTRHPARSPALRRNGPSSDPMSRGRPPRPARAAGASRRRPPRAGPAAASRG